MYKTIGYIALGVAAAYVTMRITFHMAGQRAMRKNIQAEFDHVLHSDEHKAKGRYE